MDYFLDAWDHILLFLLSMLPIFDLWLHRSRGVVDQEGAHAIMVLLATAAALCILHSILEYSAGYFHLWRELRAVSFSVGILLWYGESVRLLRQEKQIRSILRRQ